MKFLLVGLIFLANNIAYAGPRIAITIDDPHHRETPLYDAYTRNRMILDALAKHNLEAALFVCGMRVDSDTGRTIVSSWNDAGHMICNHTYSHYYYPSGKISPELYANDFLRCDSMINGYSNFTKLFRYPYLKEGSGEEKRDYMRDVLSANNYKMGYVSVDASDWYIDGRMIDRIKSDSSADLSGYKNFYLYHILDRAIYYNNLAVKVLGREPAHVLLLHHNLLNALFLDDLIQMFKDNGWEVINASHAFKDEIYSLYPDVIPAGESIIWSLAKETGMYDDLLRYPAEDGEYEKEKMDALGL